MVVVRLLKFSGRWLLRLIGGLLVFVVLGSLWLISLHDEALLPDTDAVLHPLKQEAPAPGDNIFFTLLGFTSAMGNDPNAEGQRIFKLYQQASAPSAGDPDQFDLFKRLGVKTVGFSGDFKTLCQIGVVPSFRCIADADSRRALWEKELAENATILSRYQALAAGVPNYLNLFPPDYLGADLEIWHEEIFRAKQLLLCSWALQVPRGDVNGVINSLAADTRFWRSVLAQKHLLMLDKLLAVGQVRANLRFVSELLRSAPLGADQYHTLTAMLAPLSIAERSLAGALDGETRMTSATMNQARKSQRGIVELWKSGEGSIKDRLMVVMGSVLFQPNAIANRINRQNRVLGSLSEKPCTEYSGFAAIERRELQLNWSDYLHNPFLVPYLNMMGDAVVPAYLGYIGRVCDLEGMQRLVALQLDIRSKGIADPQIPDFIRQVGAAYTDPFTDRPMQWNPQARGLGFEAAEERDRSTMPWPL